MNNTDFQENKQILSQTDWNNMYSKTDYSKKTEHVKQHTLHYLLAFNQSDNSILPFIESKKDKNDFTLITVADKKNSNLTPLLIATMKGRFKIVQVLMAVCHKDVRSLTKERDLFGWTVLHHAKISSKEIYEFLLSHGADLNVTNNLGGTPDDVRCLIDYEVTSLSIKRTFYQSQNGDMIPVSDIGKEKLMELIGIKEYRDNPYYPANELKKLWQLPEKKGGGLDQQYQAYLKNPPFLTIKPCKELQAKTEHALELCAGEDLKLGTIISEYGGIVRKTQNLTKSFLEHFDPEIVKAIEYGYNNVDASEVGNSSRYANWGWPNVGFVDVIEKGTPRKVMMVIDPAGIKKGNPILWNYGISYAHLAFGAQTLLGKTEMREYFAKYDLKTCLTVYNQGIQIISTSQDPIQKKNAIMQLLSLYGYLRFPLDTPAALLDLHFKGIITANEWMVQWLENRENVIVEWAGQYPGISLLVQSILYRLCEFERHLLKNPELKIKFGEWALNKIGSLSVMQIVKAMESILLLYPEPENISFSEELWNELKSSLEEFALYDWTKDDNGPISINRAIEDQVKSFRYLIESQKVTQNGVLTVFLEGLRYFSEYPDKETQENYQIILKIAQGLELKETLLELYQKNYS